MYRHHNEMCNLFYCGENIWHHDWRIAAWLAATAASAALLISWHLYQYLWRLSYHLANEMAA